MKRQFSVREKVLLIILALLLIFCVYYILVDKPVRETILSASERQSAAESEMTVASARLEKMHRMQSALELLSQEAQADVPDYDNARSVVELMNEAMAHSTEYTLSFEPVLRQGAIAIRPINMDFRCANYAEGKRILQILLDSPYRCRITEMSVSGVSGGDIGQQEVTVKAKVSFYEYLSPEQREAK